jgi:hypothetical protein
MFKVKTDGKVGIKTQLMKWLNWMTTTVYLNNVERLNQLNENAQSTYSTIFCISYWNLKKKKSLRDF